MKAFVYTQWGGVEQLALQETAPAELGANSVRVDLAWAGVNPLEWKILSGMYRLVCHGGFPRRIGAEGAGHVAAVGRGIRGLEVGMPVLVGLNPMDGRFGTWAEQTDAPARCVLPLPADIAPRDAAVLPIAALTAWLMCRMTRVAPGRSVLVTGASGGVGSYAVQIARSLGAQVSATASAHNRGFVEALGADEFIDYRAATLAGNGRRWDAIIDCVNSIPRSLSRELLHSSGRYVDTDPRPLTLLGDLLRSSLSTQSWQTVAVRLQQEGMHALFELLRAGKIHTPAPRELPLEQAPEALRASLAGHTVGKMLLRIGP
jgi:NADPH2:quinone reductase